MAPKPHILELRIHGIANTPPEVMLGVSRDEITSAGSDELGGFWRYKNKPGPPEDTDSFAAREQLHRTDLDPRIHTEAYSWGNMVRSGGTFGSAVVTVLIQIGWFLTLPFALCNVAYWTRRITRKGGSDHEWLSGAGAATVRLFALGLTLLLTSSLATILLDFIGTQCYRPDAMCANLPGIFQLLPRDAEGRPLRLAALSVIIVLAILLLFLLTRSSRLRYEANLRSWAADTRDAGEVARAKTELPLLATSGFWSSARVGPTSERLHLAASLALIVSLLAWDRIFTADAACHELVGFFSSSGCSATGMLAASPRESWILGIAAAVLLLATVLTGFTTAKSPKRIRVGRIVAAVLLLVVAADYAVYVIATGLSGGEGTGGESGTPVTAFLGLTVVPTVLVALLAVGCVAALWWRDPRFGRWAIILPLLAMAFITYGGLAQRAGPLPQNAVDLHWAIQVGIGLLAVHVVIAVILARRRTSSRYEAWHGFGGAVALTLSLTSALLLTCLLVFGVRTWLTPPVDSSKVVDNWRIFADPSSTPARPDLPEQLTIPAVFESYGVAVLAILVVIAIVATAAAIRQWWGPYRRLTTPTITFPEGTSKRQESYDEILVPGTFGPGYPVPDRGVTTPTEREVEAGRRFAAFAQRGEAIGGVLALTSLLAIAFVVTLSFMVPDGALAGLEPGKAGFLGDIAQTVDLLDGVALAVMTAIAAVATALVIGNVTSPKERPLGLLWDILCFFPRAAHPLAPPCYSERTVPELTTRVLEWLGPGTVSPRLPLNDPAPSRKVVITAHSMGGVLASATVFAVLNRTEPVAVDVWGRLGLVTFGIQLRAYFSRFFPDVLGPDVLGVQPCRGPGLFSHDPWHRQVVAEHEPDREWLAEYEQRFGPGMREILASRDPVLPAWVSLWRRTDFIGFPATSYNEADNPIDRGATESEPRSYLWKVATHSDYQFTLQYVAGLQEVIDRLEGPGRTEGTTRAAPESG
ncbi:hypothetical protein C7K25_05110 [Gulosibacter molinativorax]|uniref:Fungal lipase-like domain-containing protein n=1 Tax=Gulosibacter molinativorax TaxID=256821 RepID=A0ABT7C6B1_9MICO|nr:hypothetical protein [Gulosibacter molinativorax]